MIIEVQVKTERLLVSVKEAMAILAIMKLEFRIIIPLTSKLVKLDLDTNQSELLDLQENQVKFIIEDKIVLLILLILHQVIDKEQLLKKRVRKSVHGYFLYF